MQWRNSLDSYGAVAKLLHWVIVLLVIVQYLLAEAAEELPDGLEKFALLTRHKSLGMLILGLAVVRVLWKMANRGRPAPVAMPVPQRTAAAAAHALLYVLLLAQPISGWMMSSAANYPVSFFGLFQFPALVAPDPEFHEALEEGHELIFQALAFVAIVHALAALYHHFWMKDDALRRMLPFVRSRTP